MGSERGGGGGISTGIVGSFYWNMTLTRVWFTPRSSQYSSNMNFNRSVMGSFRVPRETHETDRIKPDIPTPLNLNPLGTRPLGIEFALYLRNPTLQIASQIRIMYKSDEQSKGEFVINACTQAYKKYILSKRNENCLSWMQRVLEQRL